MSPVSFIIFFKLERLVVIFDQVCSSETVCAIEQNVLVLCIIGIKEELLRRGSDWQYIFEMEHLPLHQTKPSLVEKRYLTVGHLEGNIFSSWACESGCYSTKPVLK